MHSLIEFTGGAAPEGVLRGDAASDDAQALFTRLSHEIAHCAGLAADLQDAFAPAEHGSAVDIRKMQSLDLLEQTLRDLQAVTATLATEGTAGGISSLVQGCKLDDVSRRLQGLPAATHTDEADFF